MRNRSFKYLAHGASPLSCTGSREQRDLLRTR
jgi:hypothetical protein